MGSLAGGASTCPGSKIELRCVQVAFDFTAFRPAVCQRGILVRTGIVDGEKLPIFGMEDGNSQDGEQLLTTFILPPRRSTYAAY